MDVIPQINRTNSIFDKIRLNVRVQSILDISDSNILWGCVHKRWSYPAIAWCWGSWNLVAGMWVKLASLWVEILQEAGGWRPLADWPRPVYATELACCWTTPEEEEYTQLQISSNSLFLLIFSFEYWAPAGYKLFLFHFLFTWTPFVFVLWAFDCSRLSVESAGSCHLWLICQLVWVVVLVVVESLRSLWELP